MLFDKMSSFSENQSVAVTANGKTTSAKAVDFRLNGEDVDNRLFIYAQTTGGTNAAGSITTVVQTSADGETWVDVASQTQSGEVLYAGPVPRGVKRFVRLSYEVGATALDKAVTVKSGLVTSLETAELPTLQAIPAVDGNGKLAGSMEDLAPVGDAVNAAS